MTEESKPKILIVEDEDKISRVLQLELGYENYETHIARDGKEGLELMMDDNEWNLVLLDIMLPKLSGLEVLRRFRKEDEDTPVILLTARDEVYDKVNGLDLGADDYITKPFQIEELLARIRVHLRKPKKTIEEKRNTLFVGDLKVDIDGHEVTHGDAVIELTAREFDLLACLLQNKNIVMTREQLMDQVWGYDYIGETNVVDVYIRYLRQKIEKVHEIKYILTVRGVGYTIKDIK